MTPVQRRNLQLYLRFRDQNFTISGLFWANRRIYFFLLALFGAIAALFYFIAGAIAASFVAVAFASMILRDIAHCRRSISIWPVLREVLDWEKVEKLLSSDGTDQA